MKHLHSSFRSHQKVLVICLLALLAVPMLASDIEIKLRATLTGPVFNGEQPSGKAEFEVENGVKRFSVEVDNINLPDGTAVAVFANGTKVGTIKLVAQGGTLLLSSAAGQTVPNITVGSTVAVRFSGVRILGGKF
jgi:hypothetical protein